MRLIYAEDAIRSLMAYEKGEKTIGQCIDDTPTIEPEPDWTPCSERLPEPRTDVWCNSDLGQMPGFYDETTETWYRGDYLELLVNAWMPLPEPYQPKEESK